MAMETRMNILIAQEKISDLERKVEAHRREEVVDETPAAPVIALRLAGHDEASQLAELASLDSQRPLNGDVLVALVDGQLVAAISLVDGRVVANPLRRTVEVRALLQTRAAQLAPKPRKRRRPRRRRFRLRLA
jgi:hypothetical protein